MDLTHVQIQKTKTLRFCASIVVEVDVLVTPVIISDGEKY
jgi:hypothetical protein